MIDEATAKVLIDIAFGIFCGFILGVMAGLLIGGILWT